MERFTIQIAGHVVDVTTQFPHARKYCEEYLCDGTPEFAIELTPQDITFERVTAEQEREIEGLPKKVFRDHVLERTALQRKIAEKLFEYNTLLFHGSVIAVDGQAYLFTAKSGTGKSTHTRLWRKKFGDRAVMINDDKPLLKICDNQVMVCGTPWDGKHRLNTNCIVPLKAICILERGEENHITPISAGQALPMLFQQSHRPANIAKYMDLINDITALMPFYALRCNMDISAAEIAYEAMR